MRWRSMLSRGGEGGRFPADLPPLPLARALRPRGGSRLVLATFACLGALSFPAAPAAAREPRNLVPNGSFEKGDRRGPSGWQRPDGLTSFWARGGRRGSRCLRIDTDVLASQFRKREDEMRAAEEKGREPPPAPKRLPTRPPRYDTVAGLDGVHFSSDRIPIDPARHYELRVDARVLGKGSPKVWIKAYARVRSRGGVRERIVWKKALDCVGAGRRWATYRTVFPRRTRIPSSVTYVRVQLYPYWPPATYEFDDVRLREIDEEAARAFDVDRDRRDPPLDPGAEGGSGEEPPPPPPPSRPRAGSRGRRPR